MKMGFYEGVNLSLAYCDDCGYQELEMDECPKCGSPLEEKGRKNPKIVCSNEKCGFVIDKPADENEE